MVILAGVEKPPSTPDDICGIFEERRDWYRSAKRAAETWGVPEAVQMAIIHRESSFRARVRPRHKFLWILPGPRRSSAYGYAQVLDSTWDEFRRETGREDARRHRFEDVTQFIGWYGGEIHRLTGIARDDAYGLYLAYHEGPSGYARGSHRQKAWLLEVARRVGTRAERYQQQYTVCEDRLRSRRWWLWLLAVALVAVGLRFSFRWVRGWFSWVGH